MTYNSTAYVWTNSSKTHDDDITIPQCSYFTYYDGACILKNKDAKWNLIPKQGAVTGRRECFLNTTNGKVIFIKYHSSKLLSLKILGSH